MFNLRALLALRERGHDIAVLRVVPWAPPLQARWQRYRSVPAHYDVEGIPVRTLRGLMGPRSYGIGSLALQVRHKVHAATTRFTPDIVHVHGLMPAGVLGLASDRPFVLTAHGSEAYALPFSRPGLMRLARAIVNKAGAIAAVSEYTAGRVRRIGCHDVSIIFNGADKRFRPLDRDAARAELGLPPSHPIILFVGHLEREKGVLDLVEALRGLQDLQPLALFAGSGSLARSIANGRIFGSVDHDTLSLLYAAADVVALPSYREGLPTVICEAMCSGRVVVASRVGGIPEIVRDGETGWLIEAGDVTALRDRLRRALDDTPQRRTMQEAAARFGREHLTWDENARSYEALYERVLTERPRTR